MSAVPEAMSLLHHPVVKMLQDVWPQLVIDWSWSGGGDELSVKDVCPVNFGVHDPVLFRLNMSEGAFWGMILSGGYNRFGLDALACFLQETEVPDHLNGRTLFFGGVRLIHSRTGKKFAVYAERVCDPLSGLYVWQLGIHATTCGTWFRPGSCVVAVGQP